MELNDVLANAHLGNDLVARRFERVRQLHGPGPRRNIGLYEHVLRNSRERPLKILCFAEGAHPRSGGMGLVGVPPLCRALADQDHHIVLSIAGRPIPGSEPYIRPLQDVAGTSNGTARFMVNTYPAIGRWSFAPALLNLGAAAAEADFVMLHSLYSFPVLAGYILAVRHHRPYGLWPHGVLAPIQRQVGARHKSVYDRLVGRRILDEASVLFYSAEGERDEAAPLELKAPTAIIPHGIDVEQCSRLPPRGRFRAKYLNGHSGPLVLYVGRLNAKKGLDLLVQVMSEVSGKVPDLRLVIAGSGDPPAFRDQVQRWIADCGLGERALLTGYLADEEKRSALADADVFVLPSHAENFGFAMFEAMASRLPVVISDTLNFAGEVTNHAAGVVVTRTVADFAGAIERLLGDPALRKQMGDNGRRLAEKYGWRRAGEQLDQAIRGIVERSRRPSRSANA